jgi:glycerophosphoryl diester phosphodiesterase
MVFRIVSGGVLLALALVLLRSSAGAAVLSIAHRGNALYAPENTVAAFQSALGKADLVEADVRVSNDGKLVIMHDELVDRTTDGVGALAGMTLSQLKRLDAGSWFSPGFAGERVPTLEEMITNTLPAAVPLIEQKAGAASLYVDELRRLNVVTNVIVQSFDWNFLAALRALEPGVRLGALGSGTFTASSLMGITNSGATIVAWEKASVTPAVVSLVHGVGLALYVWTVDSPAEIQHFISLGVDGIISNDPATVRGGPPAITNPPVYLGDRLAAYWRMDDGLAHPFTTTVADSQGTNTATLVRNDGASHWFGTETARLGGCVKLEGTNAFVIVPQTETLNINTNAFSLSAWVWLSQLPSQLSTSFGAIFDSTTDCYVLYLDRGNKELRFKITDINAHAARPGIPEAWLQTNRWLHVAATFDGAVAPASGRACIYLDGQLRDAHTGNDNTAPIGLTGNVKPGQAAAMGREGPSGGNCFTGMVDDVALWKRVLTQTEIQQLFEAGQTGQSLESLLRQPTPLIQLVSVRSVSPEASVEIRFRNHGPWQTFRLGRADTCNGPFQIIEGLSPTALGGGEYRFVHPRHGEAPAYFRIRGE